MGVFLGIGIEIKLLQLNDLHRVCATADLPPGPQRPRPTWIEQDRQALEQPTSGALGAHPSHSLVRSNSQRKCFPAKAPML